MKKLLLVIAVFATSMAVAQNSTLLFNGSSQFVEIPDNNNLDLNSNFTLEAWINPTGVGSNPTEGGMIINKEASYEIARFADGTIRYALSANGAGSDLTWVNTGVTAPLNSLSHIALVKSGTSVILYLNGVSVFTGTGPATLTANTQVIRIANRAQIAHLFNGYIDEVRIWNASRTQAAIKSSMFNKNLSNSAANLVAYYRMNDGSGTVAANSATNSSGINGTLVGSPTWISSPVQFSKNSLGLDGTNDVVTVPNSSSLNISSAITIEAWVYATSTATVQNVVSKSSFSVNNGYIFPRTDDGWNTTNFYLHIGGSWRILGAPFPSRNAWHHLAATYDGSFIRIYINGVQAASAPQTGAITTNANNLAIGNQLGYSEFFGGRVDEIRIWNVARTQTEIASNMTLELDPDVQTNLVSYYTFNHGIASGDNSGINTMVDFMGNNNGTLSNFAWSGAVSNFLVQPNSLAALPVSWTKFTGSLSNKDILLQWNTAIEQNTKSFIIQHSVDGNSWTNLATMAAAGNSSIEREYKYLHVNPTPGVNYYRIKQIDLDQNSSISKVVIVQTRKVQAGFEAFPNPVTGRTINVELKEAAEIIIYNNLGNIIVRKSLSSGRHRLQIPIVPAGLYHISNGKQTVQLVVQ